MTASRELAIDGLRGIAALMIFVHHAQLPIIGSLTGGLDAGVMIFFALSGYLLYGPFLRGPVNLQSYAIRRLARILPAYLIASIGIAVLWYPSFLSDPIGILTMQRTPVVVVWTLQLEVAFYVLLPLIAKLVAGQPLRLLLMALGSVAWTVVSAALIIGRGQTATNQDVGTILSYLWAFVPGMLVAASGRARWPAWLAAPGIALIAVSVVVDLPSYLDIAAGAGSGLLIAAMVGRSVPRPVVRLCALGGAMSYSFYLWHEAIIDAVDRPATSLGAVLAFVVVIVAAAIVYALVERPAMNAGRRLTTSGHARRTESSPVRALQPETGLAA